MAPASPQIILYGYSASPFLQKLVLVLNFKRLEYSLVKVPRQPPRDALAALGITYRRIPVLFVGGECYVDTHLAVLALERIFPQHPLFSPGLGQGTTMGGIFFWADRAIFKISSGLLPKDVWDEAFVKDRSAFVGGKIDPEKMEQARPLLLSGLRQHMALVEQQLETNGGKRFLVADSINYIDLSLFFTLEWVSTFGTADSIFKSTHFPRLSAWLATMRTSVVALNASRPSVLTPAAAQAQILSTLPSSYVPLALDAEEPLLVAGWVKLGGLVEVTPDDTGRVPQRGTLLALNAAESVLGVQGQGGIVRVHFPRLGFGIAKAKEARL